MAVYRLKLNAKQCISCGICMDLCPPRAIGMRSQDTAGIEGSRRLDLAFAERWGEAVTGVRKETFPCLQTPDLCDGCGVCVRECPALALDVLPHAVLMDR